MKTIVFLLIGAAALLVSAGCEGEGHEHNHYGGAYEGTYRGYGHEQSPGYQAEPDGWHRSDDWREH